MDDRFCPSHDTDPLTTTASIISILTFAYAIIVGLLLYSSAIRDSKRQIKQLVVVLETLSKEAVICAQSVPSVRYEHTSKDSVQSIMRRIETLLSTLREMTGNFDGVNGWLSIRWLKARIRFPFIQEELQKKITEKDQLVFELHRLLDR